MDAIKLVENSYKKGRTSFRVGDTVKVSMSVKEGDKQRVQAFEGVVISLRGSGTPETFTVRKISYGVGIEKIFPLHSPLINNIELIKEATVRRAKLYYLREKKGKAVKLKEKTYVKSR